MDDRINLLSRLTAAEILAIREPERLFTGEESALKREYRHLAFLWHPDRCSDAFAREVLPHINALFETAREKLVRGDWQVPGLLTLSDTAGKEYRFRFRMRRPFELGEMLIGNTVLTFLVEGRYKAFFDNAVRRIGNFLYASDAMKQEVSRYLPRLRKLFETHDGRFVMVLEKDPDLLLLGDVLDHYITVGLPPVWDRHVAWIQSTLHNLCCYLEYAELTHNDISPDTYFISPKGHYSALLGGWWYSERIGERLSGVTGRTFGLMPPDVQAEGIADPRVDLELARSVGRELLGDISGMKLLHTRPAPEAMLNWLRLPGSGNAREDYRLWREQVLTDSFGPRRFVDMKLNADDLYGKEVSPG
jgi:hypothetical protein